MRHVMTMRVIALIVAAGASLGPGLEPAALAGGEACLKAARGAKGPPMICHPIVIGTSRSLPFGNDAFEGKKNYRTSDLVKDTLSLLKAERSALVRMETLRRATVYVAKDRALGTELLAKLSWKAMDSDAAGRPKAAEWFDAAYLAGCFEQTGVDIDWNAGVSGTIIGYSWMKHALTLDPDDAEMQFGAALMTLPAMHREAQAEYDAHVRRAAAGAEKGSLLEVNLAAHLSNWGSSIEKVRAGAGRAGDAATTKAAHDPGGN